MLEHQQLQFPTHRNGLVRLVVNKFSRMINALFIPFKPERDLALLHI